MQRRTQLQRTSVTRVRRQLRSQSAVETTEIETAYFEPPYSLSVFRFSSRCNVAPNYSENRSLAYADNSRVNLPSRLQRSKLRTLSLLIPFPCSALARDATSHPITAKIGHSRTPTTPESICDRDYRDQNCVGANHRRDRRVGTAGGERAGQPRCQR